MPWTLSRRMAVTFREKHGLDSEFFRQQKQKGITYRGNSMCKGNHVKLSFLLGPGQSKT